jgi:hypothetical protein
MADVNHNTLTDPYLHEPKGISTALAGQLYVADGSGSGTWVENSRIFGGYLTFSTGSPYAHSVTTSDTALNPTFTTSVNNGFTGLSSPNARVRYDGAETINASIDGSFSIQQASGTLRQVEMVFYKNGTQLPGSRVISTATSGEWHTITFSYDTTLATDDYLEVFVKANSAATINFASGYLRIFGIAA